MSIQPVRIALVGLGLIAKKHLRVFRTHPQLVELAAVCDANAAALAKVGGEFQLPTACLFTDFAAMLREVPLDAVDICTPHELHFPQARSALDAGKHVLLEKPLAITLPECLELVAAAEAANRTLMAAFNYRYHPPYRALRRALDTGQLPPVRTARAEAHLHIASFTPTEHWIYSPGNAGGVLFTLALHRLDLLRYLCGNIRRITAATCHSLHPNLHHDLEDQCTARLEFDSGATAELYVSYPPELAPPIESLILYDDAGHQLVSPPTPDDLPTADMFTNELLHFADCIRTGATPISSGRDALQSMQALFALAESARRQSQVDIAEFE